MDINENVHLNGSAVTGDLFTSSSGELSHLYPEFKASIIHFIFTWIDELTCYYSIL